MSGPRGEIRLAINDLGPSGSTEPARGQHSTSLCYQYLKASASPAGDQKRAIAGKRQPARLRAIPRLDQLACRVLAVEEVGDGLGPRVGQPEIPEFECIQDQRCRVGIRALPAQQTMRVIGWGVIQSDDSSPIRREPDSMDDRSNVLDPPKELSPRNIPERNLTRRRGAGGCQSAAVGAEAEVADAAVVARFQCARLTGFQIPEANRPGIVAGCQGEAVGRPFQGPRSASWPSRTRSRSLTS